MDGTLGGLGLLDLGINRGKDGISGDVARRPALLFDAHVVACCRCDRSRKRGIEEVECTANPELRIGLED